MSRPDVSGAVEMDERVLRETGGPENDAEHEAAEKRETRGGAPARHARAPYHASRAPETVGRGTRGTVPDDRVPWRTMATGTTMEHAATTLPFEGFFTWLQSHPNCILRAGTPEAVLYDDDDLHWHFAAEGSDTMVVQLLRGKQLVGELLVSPGDVAYVQGVAGEDDEFVFELISETETDRVAAYYFVLSHGYDAQNTSSGRAVH